MQLRKISILLLAGLCCPSVYGQDAVESKTADQYVGLQANQLVRQVLNFGNAPAVSNPYLLTYAVNSKTMGTGFTAGLGYTYNQFNDGDAITSRQSTQSSFFLRLGIEKKVFWTKHWMISYGIDVVIDAEKDLTETSFNPGGGSNIQTLVESKTNRTGLGPRFSLNYVFTERLIIGTEASYYFKGGTEKIKDPSLPASTQNSKSRSFNLAVPSVIYLILKF
jgi:hypothetical protein